MPLRRFSADLRLNLGPPGWIRQTPGRSNWTFTGLLVDRWPICARIAQMDNGSPRASGLYFTGRRADVDYEHTGAYHLNIQFWWLLGLLAPSVRSDWMINRDSVAVPATGPRHAAGRAGGGRGCVQALSRQRLAAHLPLQFIAQRCRRRRYGVWAPDGQHFPLGRRTRRARTHYGTLDPRAGRGCPARSAGRRVLNFTALA